MAALSHTSSSSGPDHLIEMLEGLERAPEEMGLTLVDRRFEERFVSYRDFLRRVRRHAAHLAAQGVRPGQHVAITLATELDLMTCFLGLVYLGAVPVSLSPPMAGQKTEAWLDQLRSLMRRFGLERAALSRTLDESARGHQGFEATCLLESRLPAEPELSRLGEHPPARVQPEDLAYVQFSSGSTAKPKGIRITHRNIAYNLAWAVGDAPREAHHTGLTWLPLYHDMGLVGGFLSNLLLPNRAVIMHTLCFLMKPVSWLDCISRHRVDGTNGPNFALDVCVWRIPERALAESSVDLRSLKYLGVGAEPIQPASVERFVKRFEPWGFDRRAIHPGYGMAEATLMATSIPYREGLKVKRVDGQTVVSVGRPVGDTLVRILDAEGREQPTGSVGEVALAGSSVCDGYLDEPAETAASFRDGWFHTGDLGLLDSGGDLYITGRLKDLIIVQGRNFFGHEIARCTEELPAVAKGKAFAFGVRVGERERVVVLAVPARRPPARLGQRAELLARGLGLGGWPGRLLSWPLALMGTLAGRFQRLEAPELERRIRRHLLAELGLAVDDVLLVSHLPKTSSGKVKRDACEALYRETSGSS